ncbi:predicted protein [Postia placenta Mad-698-R]|nr:predicted protein [Postia placenta Mad-698-R]
MPKAKPFIVTAKHEPTGLLERIAIHNTHKFDDVGKPRRIAGPSYEYEPPKPLPDIHFQRTKILLRTSEYNEMFAATADRLEPVFARMEKEEGSLEPEVVAKVRRMGDGFDELYHGLEKKARRLTNRHWRVIKRDLKRIGHVSFEDLSSRLPDICNELASLNITFKYEV